MASRPVASYRIQLTPDAGFDATRRQVARLDRLGISHVYLSPVTQAVPGSSHGYDVVDHTRVRDELGGLDGLTALLDDLAAVGMAAVIDHVPNHVAVGAAELNPRWWELLRDGPTGPADRWFDVDWEAGGGKVLLPVLDRPLDDLLRSATVVDGELHLGGLRLPLAAGTDGLPVPELLDRQHYALLHWRRPERNVRRFFTIDGLAAVRVEHPEVAVAVDTVPRLLVDHPGFGGVRVDHVDGLADPGRYLAGLRDLLGDRWIVVEKILAPHEVLPGGWPVDGTTGYEHARVLEHALLDRAGWSALATRWAVVGGDVRPFRAWELDARREVLAGGLAPDVARVAKVAASAGLDHATSSDAVTELSVHLERYRTYLPGDGQEALDDALTGAVASRPDLADALHELAAYVIDGDHLELRTRWQQLTGPATAKGVEDRAFWRYLALSSLGEVGGQAAPTLDADPVAALHAHHAETQAGWPATMLAGTTHDVARSEDVRAFGLVLAAVVPQWSRVVDEWASMASFRDLDEGVQWLAMQTLVTAPGLSAERLAAFLVKATREADRSTSWTEPDEAYEARLAALSQDLLVWPPLAELAASIDRQGRAVALATLAVRATAPGVPDVYQGTEAFRFLLVDPDNRQPPDQDDLDTLVDRAVGLDAATAWAEPTADAARAVVLHRLLALRRRRPDVFGPGGGYRWLAMDDDHDGAVIAFARLDPAGTPQVLTVVGRPGGDLTGATLALPDGRWHHVLVDDDAELEANLDLVAALETFPAVVLERVSD